MYNLNNNAIHTMCFKLKQCCLRVLVQVQFRGVGLSKNQFLAFRRMSNQELQRRVCHLETRKKQQRQAARLRQDQQRRASKLRRLHQHALWVYLRSNWVASDIIDVIAMYLLEDHTNWVKFHANDRQWGFHLYKCDTVPRRVKSGYCHTCFCIACECKVTQLPISNPRQPAAIFFYILTLLTSFPEFPKYNKHYLS